MSDYVWKDGVSIVKLGWGQRADGTKIVLLSIFGTQIAFNLEEAKRVRETLTKAIEDATKASKAMRFPLEVVKP